MIGQLCKRPNCLVRIYVSTNGCTDPNYRKTSFLKMLTARGVIPKSLISIHSNMPKLTKKTICLVRTDIHPTLIYGEGLTSIVEKLCF